MDQFWSIFDQFWPIFDIIGQKVFKNWLWLPERHELFAGLGTTQKNVNWEGETPHILPKQGNKMGGHRTKFQTLAVGRLGGWLGSFKNNATPWPNLAR